MEKIKYSSIMKKYYFFKIELRQNIQGELRKTVLPLPGQTTYVTLSDRNHPVDTNLKVQLALRQNTLVCSLPGIEDVVIGVCHEGNREKELKLIQQSRMLPVRNEENAPLQRVYFYRTEAQVFLVKRPAWFLDQEVAMPLADDDMFRAYEALLAGSRPDTGTQQQTATAPNDETPAEAEPASAFDPTAFAPDSEIGMVEDHLRLGCQETTAMTCALYISRLRDRMRAGVVAFSYMKQNGSLRKAYGTRNPDVIRLCHGNTDLSARRPDASNDGAHFHYFDIQQGDWRCFCTEDFQSITDEEVVPANNFARIRQISYTPITES